MINIQEFMKMVTTQMSPLFGEAVFRCAECGGSGRSHHSNSPPDGDPCPRCCSSHSDEEISSERMAEAVSMAVSEQLGTLKPLINDDYKINAASMWESWSRWKRILWIILNVTRVRRFASYIYNKRSAKYRAFMDSALYHQLADKDVLSEVRSSFEEQWRKCNWKWWYEASPKSIILVNMSIRPTKPAEIIELKMIIEK